MFDKKKIRFEMKNDEECEWNGWELWESIISKVFQIQNKGFDKKANIFDAIYQENWLKNMMLVDRSHENVW